MDDSTASKLSAAEPVQLRDIGMRVFTSEAFCEMQLGRISAILSQGTFVGGGFAPRVHDGVTRIRATPRR